MARTGNFQRFEPGEQEIWLAAFIPSSVREILQRLNDAGHEAYVVGGCVRDFLMGKGPSDWDVCTSAEPMEIKACFSDMKTTDTGLKHGTITVILKSRAVEITTYRVDGAYSDGRRPDSVAFTKSLTEDLARRDFTVNAMAFHPACGLCDPFGGRQDLKRRLIRCVGDPAKRFAEDGLRVMRGLRFAAVLGFDIDGPTAEAMQRLAPVVDKVSRERVNAELSKLILGCDADRVLERYAGILTQIIEGLRPAEVGRLPMQLSARLAAVFPKETQKYLSALKYGRKTVREASALSRLAKVSPPRQPVEIKKLLAAEGVETVRLYFAMFGMEAVLERVLAAGGCWSLHQLAVTGKDLTGAGVPPGKQVGELLDELLRLVIEEKLDNRKEALLEYVKGRAK